MSEFQRSKSVVREFYRALDAAPPGLEQSVLTQFATPDYRFRGVHPFNELSGAPATAATVYAPLRRAWRPLQRREDIFMAGRSEIDQRTWVCSMGHLLGLSEAPWLGIPPTGKATFLRYVEFHRIEGERIAETALFCDIVGVMKQAGLQPLPVQTGAEILTPGPRTHDGLLLGAQDPAESVATLALVNRMVADLIGSGSYNPPADVLARTWRQDMLWFGPSGIGATFSIPRYIEQHQGPFGTTLADIQHNGHKCRFAEGNYACFFGWPNLTITSTGGFMGLPASDKRLNMRVVDLYRREGEQLAENWIFIDVLYWMLQQGVDVLERTVRIATGR